MLPDMGAARRTEDGLAEAPIEPRTDHGMIRLTGRSRRGPQVSPKRDSTLADLEQSNTDLQRELAELRRSLDERTQERAEALHERDEALQRQTATAEVLGVINSSPGDLAPVFDAILEKAHSLCGAAFGSLFTYDGEFFHGAASHGMPEAIRPDRRAPFRPGLNNPLWQLAHGAPLAHVPDMRELAGASEPGHLLLRAVVEQGG